MKSIILILIVFISSAINGFELKELNEADEYYLKPVLKDNRIIIGFRDKEKISHITIYDLNSKKCLVDKKFTKSKKPGDIIDLKSIYLDKENTLWVNDFRTDRYSGFSIKNNKIKFIKELTKKTRTEFFCVEDGFFIANSVDGLFYNNYNVGSIFTVKPDEEFENSFVTNKVTDFLHLKGAYNKYNIGLEKIMAKRGDKIDTSEYASSDLFMDFLAVGYWRKTVFTPKNQNSFWCLSAVADTLFEYDYSGKRTKSYPFDFIADYRLKEAKSRFDDYGTKRADEFLARPKSMFFDEINNKMYVYFRLSKRESDQFTKGKRYNMYVYDFNTLQGSTKFINLNGILAGFNFEKQLAYVIEENNKKFNLNTYKIEDLKWKK